MRREELKEKAKDIGIKLLRLPGQECQTDGQEVDFDQSMIYLCQCGAPFIPYEIGGNVVDKCPDCMKTAVLGKHFHKSNLQPTVGVTIGAMS
jgi:hypothetical protein